ncbi:predicted protein [Plenodomus lingam JN3]|uniref:Predicted protein n=1 Tax=Leptosphaeria maculans (strain JN3 / isolate v23.1.3 / race Av1-4-5-6-7-8) TaxID=985895 RepID=E4ZQ99_LEPMJ|nr:predicted protein [Plenodomus lingam JN3]CBX90009.1 predicted protein [Plenodomus lingam JN3]
MTKLKIFSIYKNTNTSVLIKNIVSLNYRFYSTDNNITPSCTIFVPVISYPNADTKKTDILQDNKDKVGIYR